MDRQIIYPGQIPLDTDLLNTNKNAMVALGKLAGAALGTSTVVNGLAVTPSATAMNVAVAPGEIYSLQNIDGTTYGSLAADTTNQIVKQGILLTAINLACPAPTTAGQSINYLIQATFSETDTGSVTLPYFNSSNPTQAWSGPANAGTAQATVRQDLCAVTVVAGTAATTGTQTTPAPTSGAIGLAVVTVAYGATSIVSGNITPYFDTSIVPQSGLASNVAHAIYTKSVAGSSNVTLTAQEAAYPLLTLTGAITANINVIVPAVSRQRVINNLTTGAFNVTVKTAAGTGITVPQNQTLSLYCDGVNVLNESSASLMPAPYADATGTSDAITANYAVGNPTLYDGYPLALGIVTPNTTATPTFAPTLNGTLQTARTIVKFVGNVAVALFPGDLQGDAELRYDLPGTRWILQNPSLTNYPVTVRQTVMGGPDDTAGLPTFFPASSASLTLTTQNISTGPNALVLTSANGWDARGDVNNNALITTNQSWTVPNANATNYLGFTISGGVATPYQTTLQPIYQWGGTPSVTNGQATFNIQEMKMYLGNGTTAPQTNLVFVGEAVSSTAVPNITSATAYAYNGRYQAADTATLPGVATVVSRNHNIGVTQDLIAGEFYIINLTAEQNYAVGDVILNPLIAPVTVYAVPVPIIVTSKTIQIVTGAINAIEIVNKTTGVTIVATAANWAYAFRARRIF